MDVLLSLSNEYAYFRDQAPVRLADLGHDPWFWAIPKKGKDPDATRGAIEKAWKEVGSPASGPDSDLAPLQKIKRLGDLTQVRSFVNHATTRPAFPVYARRSFFVPEISDELFYSHDVYTAEHDIPYQQRACVDLAAQDKAWAFDSKGAKTKLKVLVYDIETTQFGRAKRVPIDMIGWSEFEVSYTAAKDLDKEEFHFDLVDEPPRWQDCEVVQWQARTPDEEVDNLLKFVRRVPNYHVISGHNILAFDNKEVFERIHHYLGGNERDRTLGDRERKAFEEFTTRWAAKDRTFTFGQQAETVNFHPTSLDTYHAARRFYFFLDDFTLKKVAPFLGVVVPDRVYLSPSDLKLDDARTLAYNKHDVQEQLGITALLLAQALPLAFTTGWTFEELLTGGNVRIWDHMAMIRAARQRKLMPATCRAQGIARTVLKNLGTRPTKEGIADDARSRMRDASPPPWLKEYVRVAKYGDEMPDWVELPHVIINPKAVQEPGPRENGGGEEAAEEEEELLSYAIPGGMTIHPQEVKSQFVPWWYVVDADVGAMYPTILRAKNVGPDTVRLARKGETPDDWVWLYKVNEEFAKDERWVFREPDEKDTFARPGEGVMVGVKIAATPGLVPLAMKGIMGIAARLKRQLSAAKKSASTSKAELERLQMAYASVKATRNAGTHGQMLAVNVSCRGFNLWAGAEITTVGQRILAESLGELKAIGARVVYGDSIVGDRCVVVRNPRGLVEVLPIRQLWHLLDSATHHWHGKRAKLGSGWEALCQGTHADAPAEWKAIRRIICHDAGKHVVRVRQTDGETICTEDHSVMVRRDGRMERARPEETLSAPLVRVQIPRNDVLDEIDLAEVLAEPAALLNERIGPDRLFNPPRAIERFGRDDNSVWFANPYYFGVGARRARSQIKRRIKVGSEECSALCRLLGAYVSEGSASTWDRLGASIANSDVGWLERRREEFLSLVSNQAAGIIPSYAAGSRTITLSDGRTSTYTDATWKIQMSNAPAALFFWALGGRGSARKRVPGFLFNLPRKHQEEFLTTLVEGDGSRKWGPRYRPDHGARFFRYETKSLELASGLAVLLSQMGLDFGIRHNTKKGTHILFTRGKKKPNFRPQCEPWPNEGPVFDLEVEDHHTFVEAYGGILLHNTDGLYLACSRSGRNLMHVSEALGESFEPREESWILHPDAAFQAISALNDKWRKYLGYEDFELEAGSHDAMIFVVHKNYLIFDVKNGKLRMQTKGNNFRGSDKAPVAQKILEQIMVNSLKDLIAWDDEEKAREGMKAAIKRWTQEAVKGLDPSNFERADLTLIQLVQPPGAYAQAGPGIVVAGRNPILDAINARRAVVDVRVAEGTEGTVDDVLMKAKASGIPIRTLPKKDIDAAAKGRDHQGIIATVRTDSVWTKRARALEQITGERLQAPKKYRFVVCKNPLPGIDKPSAKGLKPLDFMWPIEATEDPKWKAQAQIDLGWYRDMIEKYVRGAFGFEDLELHAQKGLDAWM